MKDKYEKMEIREEELKEKKEQFEEMRTAKTKCFKQELS